MKINVTAQVDSQGFLDDVDASAKLVEELGGQIKLPPMDIPDVGRFALIQDPQGAILSIISYHSN